MNVRKSLFTLFPFTLVGFLFLCLYYLTISQYFTTNSGLFSNAIIVDVSLVIPFLYFLSIRKSSIPRITIVPIFILGVFFASYILPASEQRILTGIKTYAIPIIELFVVGFVGFQIYRIRRQYRLQKKNTPDFHSALQLATQNILPKTASALLTTELSVFYYGFFHWKKVDISANKFSYHTGTGTTTMLYAVLVAVVAETFGLHAIISKWSVTWAWVATGISVYSGFQVFGIARSLTKRPFVVSETELKLTYGIINEVTIPFRNIKEVEYSKRAMETNKTTRFLSPFAISEGHNTIITLKEPQTLKGIYAINREFTTLAFHVDDIERFKRQLPLSHSDADSHS